MKFCIINNLYGAFSKGGAEIVAHTVALGLREQGHEVTIITLGRRYEREIKDGITLYHIHPLNIFSFIDIQNKPLFLRVPWLIIDTFNFSSKKIIHRILKDERPDFVITHNLKGIGYLIPRLLQKIKIKHIHYLHDVQLSRPSGIILYGKEKPFLILDKIYEKVCRYLFGSPDIVISPSKWLMEYYERRGFFTDSRNVIIQNPVRGVKNFSHKEKMDLTILFIGQIEESKGIFFAIHALKTLKNNFILKIVGKGSAENEVRKIIGEDPRFQLYGYVKPSQLSNVFAQSDITLVPSLCYENSPTAIYESFSHGVPVIASDIGGISELVKDGYNGFTFEPANEKNFLDVMKYYIIHPSEIDKLRNNAFNSVKSYSVEEHIKKLINSLH